MPPFSMISFLNVSTHSRPKAAGSVSVPCCMAAEVFQHTAARRRLDACVSLCYNIGVVSTHSRPKAAGFHAADFKRPSVVSTHSRPKAAGCFSVARFNCAISFNTQPPEGGWRTRPDNRQIAARFNTQPPEGGWTSTGLPVKETSLFQHTAARRRLVAVQGHREVGFVVSTHSRPKAAGDAPR